MSAQIRTVIVDDEPLARQLLARLLCDDPAFTVVGECGSGGEALAAVRRLAPELVFLDIEMPDLSGFQVVERLPAAHLPYVVFVTAWDQYAVRAFEVAALDYLLKPVEPDRFAECVARVKRRLHGRSLTDLAERVLALARDRAAMAATAATKRDGSLTLQSRGRLRRIEHCEIVWVEAADQYARVHTAGEAHLLSRPLAAVESELPASDFVRIHRSALVNLRHVREVRTARYGAHWVVLATGERVRLARGRRDLLPRLLAAAT